MKQFSIKAANKKHFDSLIRDYRKAGFMIVTHGVRFCELEGQARDFVSLEKTYSGDEDEFIVLEY